MKKEKAHSEVLTSTQRKLSCKKLGWSDRKTPSFKRSTKYSKAEKNKKGKDLPKDGGEMRRRVSMLCPLPRLAFLVYWPKAKFNSF